MKNKRFNQYYILACICVLIASFYPLSMGLRVIKDMIINGSVLKENYPKYIIPYTPIALAIIIAVIIMPLCFKRFKKYTLLAGSTIATIVFFIFELLFEKNVVVSTNELVSKLEDWQMYMCYVPPEASVAYKTQTAVDILMGNYNSSFKLHFYIIAIVLIISIINCLYGFAQIIKSGQTARLKSLIIQSISSLIFLFLCILACFTAFWRDGSIQVSPLSAALMTLFFILLGVSVGIFFGSLLLHKRKSISILIPAIISSLMTLLMYIGEMIILNGHLYQFGTSLIFTSIPYLILSLFDILVVLLSAGITALICLFINK